MICMFSFLCINFEEKNKSIQMQELCSRETFKVFDGLEILCRVFKLIYASKKNSTNIQFITNYIQIIYKSSLLFLKLQ